MPGTLTISTLSDGTNSTSATNCISGSAKAWVNFAGSSGTISASFNTSSVTRIATGYYTWNFTNGFSNTNYIIVGCSDFAPGTNNIGLPGGNTSGINGSKTTSAYGVAVLNSAGSLYDAPRVYLAAYGS